MSRARDGICKELMDAVCHDLLGPVAAIQSFAELLADGLCGPVTAEQDEAYETILRNARRVGRQVQHLRDLVTISSGELVVDPTPLDLTAIVDWLRDDFDSSCVAEGITLKVHMDPELPWVRADDRRLRAALAAVVDHAIGASHEGDTVEIRVGAARRAVRVLVRDRGRGKGPSQPELDLPRNGVEYSRLGASFDPALAISRKMVVAMGGSLCARRWKHGTETALELATCSRTTEYLS